jgi:O-methyltransferase
MPSVNELRVLLGKVRRALTRREDLQALKHLLARRDIEVSVAGRLRLIMKLYWITVHVQSPHTQAEILAFVEDILALPKDSPQYVVEAGCFVGSSTAKFSLAAALAGKTLVVFDSFAGIPPNEEVHDTNLSGATNLPGFKAGDWHGELEEVQSNVRRYGRIDVCEFVPGWFDDTMPQFDRPIAAAYIDVDLASSTRTCLRYLYPLLRSGGALFSQDGHLPLVVEVLGDESFWRDEVGYEPPTLEGLGGQKLVRMIKVEQPVDL